jgi:ADP-heptose:LPS heptosyltransferase
MDLLNIHIPAKPWRKKKPPRRILIIRWQAMGDVVITLPYLQHLRNNLPPSVKMDLLTRVETEDIPRNIVLFNKVYSIAGERNFKKQLIYTSLLLPQLFFRRYDVVIDLQNNIVSRTVRRLLFPVAWCEFDRFSANAAGERNRMTIEAVGLGKNQLCTKLKLKSTGRGAEILRENGWNGSDKLVVLNPAGFFITRNWPMENYVAFANLWLQQFRETRFLILGTSLISSKATFLKNELGDHVITLVNQTNPYTAFEILQHVSFVLSEDSGLMHMAWVSGIPTLTLFGGTRSDWSRPLGEHSFFLDSSDLPCGNCMQAECRFGDVHCLTRLTPAIVFSHANALLQRVNRLKPALHNVKS